MKTFRVLTIVTGVALTIALLSAQQQGGASGPGGNGGASGGGTTGTGGTTNPGGISRPGTNNPNSSTNPNSPFPSEVNRPIFLSGKVVLSDGTPLSGPVVIERVCNGTPHSEAYTDSKGRFSFELGQSREIFMDLSEPSSTGLRGSNGIGNSTGSPRGMEINNCDLRATLAGYRSDLIPLFNHRYMDNPDVGTIVLHKLGNVEGFTTSAISARAPKDAKKAYDKGLEAAKKSKPDEAQKEFEKAVEAYPQYATAWFELGKVFEQRDHVEEARKAYSQAVTADSKYINPYERLYMLAFRESKWQEMADTSDRVIHLNPFDFPAAYYFNGVANLQLDNLDAAEKSAREAVKLDTTHRNPKANYVLGLILARKRDFKESAENLRAYLTAAPNASDAEQVKKQLAQVEEFAQASAQPEPQN